MKSCLILAIDQGTTGTRALIYDQSAKIVSSAYQEFSQHYPKPGWVEHDPIEIWRSTLRVIDRAVKEAGSPVRSRLAAIGITNQRETTVLWERKTGRPVHAAIVWQDRRTAPLCNQLKKSGHEKTFREKTGLVLDPYFSGTKIQWLLDHVPGLRKKAGRGDILFGTIDSWLLWKMTGGRSHATDFTNASRTLLLNIKTRKWDEELLGLLKVPNALLPVLQESGSVFGKTAGLGNVLPSGIPILSMIGDQQAALYGQSCYHPGQVKNTYGTGCFMLMNLGPHYQKPPFGLLTTIACDEKGKPSYAFEGAVFIAGAAIQWLRDGLGFFKKASETDGLIRNLKDTGGVVVIPALTGLGSPYWNAEVRGMITGLTRGTTRAHIVRAALESIAHQTADVLDQMARGKRVPIRDLQVDGGATHNRFLMQFQADLLGIPIRVSEASELTAWGAAKLAARTAGVWPSLAAMDAKRRYHVFKPHLARRRAQDLRLVWKREMKRLLGVAVF